MRIYTSFLTDDHQWLVRSFDGEDFTTEPTIFDSMEEAANAAWLLTARDMERYESDLASRKFVSRYHRRSLAGLWVLSTVLVTAGWWLGLALSAIWLVEAAL